MSDQLDNKPPASKQIKSVETAIEYFKKGKMVIIVDDEGRENEGDIALPAQDCTPDNINFMATIARGLICTPLDGDIIDNLELEPMVTRNTESMGTAFTVSVDASSGIESGISAKDRSNTVRKLSDTKSTREDFVKPGHIFPLRYQKGGVLVRAGHTEGSVDLVKLSGKRPAAVICEVMNEDGTMARIDDLKKVSEKYNLPIVSIEDIIAYRIAKENLVSIVSEAKLPTKFGEFTAYGFKSEVDKSEPIALVKGNIDKNKPTLVRVHSECATGDLLGSLRCDCGDQLELALEKISKAEAGVFVYMSGSKPITDFLGDQIALKEDGGVVVDDFMSTTSEGVWAIGDIRNTPFKQAVVAASDGCIAAMAIDRFINSRKSIRVDWVHA